MKILDNLLYLSLSLIICHLTFANHIDSLSNEMINDIEQISNDLANNADPDYVYFSANIKAKQTTLKPSDVSIKNAKDKLKILDQKKKKTAIYYCYKYIAKSKDLTEAEYSKELNTKISETLTDVQNKCNSLDVNVIIILNIWVDNSIKLKNRNPDDDKINEKNFIDFKPSPDIDNKCAIKILDSIKAAIGANAIYKPIYKSETLDLIAGALEKQLVGCTDGKGKGIDVIIMSGGKKLKQGDIIYVNTTPEMPKFTLDIDLTKSKYSTLQTEVKFIFTHTFTHTDRGVSTKIDRECIKRRPSEGYFYTFNKNTNPVEIDLKTDIIIGTVKVRVFSDATAKDTLRTFSFKIYGTNPSVADLVSYVQSKGYNSEYWFFGRITKIESLKNGGQFATYNTSYMLQGQRLYRIKGMPLFGYPDGWGAMQIDNWKTPIITDYSYIFNWKKNIDRGYKVMQEKEGITLTLLGADIDNYKKWYLIDKNCVTVAKDTTEGLITYSHIKTSLSGLVTLNTYFNENTDADKKSFLDANVIKRYNGGDYYRATVYTKQKTAVWKTNGVGYSGGQAIYYVREVSNESDF